ncbi:hypothetical protein CFC21_106018 [Triticum aestivum]|uniref:Bowman-Birk serine protease inhibitors family domain-containing protein n=2 Tax=Triticum aestivum TaxID=4565 RepID=A0A9R1MDY7_WHEAT|nr:hypothetical protein CFC21_106018 [Triticum aestivum]
MRQNGMAYLIIFLFLFRCLASTTECRLMQGRSYSDGLTNTNDDNGTVVDSSKLSLIICFRIKCDDDRRRVCYSCPALPNNPKYPSLDDCKAACPACSPKCTSYN